MRLVIQRVKSAKVSVGSYVAGSIGKGLFVLIGVGRGDTKGDVQVLAEKLSKLRIMPDKAGKMNLSVVDTKSQILVVSQFTLYADLKGGNRPSFINAKDPEAAKILYDYFIKVLNDKGIGVRSGSFGEYMKIITELDGPVTIIMDSKEIK
jgi:D-tyrosyl-tRNA(Tyr) deacylase